MYACADECASFFGGLARFLQSSSVQIAAFVRGIDSGMFPFIFGVYFRCHRFHVPCMPVLMRVPLFFRASHDFSSDIGSGIVGGGPLNLQKQTYVLATLSTGTWSPCFY